jgi:hypothetical protein
MQLMVHLTPAGRLAPAGLKNNPLEDEGTELQRMLGPATAAAFCIQDIFDFETLQA